MTPIRITTIIQETATGFHIQGIEERPGLPAIVYDAGDWPLCRAAAEILAGELGYEIASSYEATRKAALATCLRPTTNS